MDDGISRLPSTAGREMHRIQSALVVLLTFLAVVGITVGAVLLLHQRDRDNRQDQQAQNFAIEQQAREADHDREQVAKQCAYVNELRDHLIEAARPIPELQAYLIATIPPLECNP